MVLVEVRGLARRDAELGGSGQGWVISALCARIHSRLADWRTGGVG